MCDSVLSFVLGGGGLLRVGLRVVLGVGIRKCFSKIRNIFAERLVYEIGILVKDSKHRTRKFLFCIHKKSFDSCHLI